MTARWSNVMEGRGIVAGTEEMRGGSVVVGDGTMVVEGERRADGAGGEGRAGSRSSLTTPSNRRTYCPVSVKSSRPNPAKFLRQGVLAHRN